VSTKEPVFGQRLTARESDVVAVIAAGNTNKDTARQLGISPRTVELHRYRVVRKLGARNTADLVRIVLTMPPPQAEAAE
jgi:two-component system response regulator FixJ